MYISHTISQMLKTEKVCDKIIVQLMSEVNFDFVDDVPKSVQMDDKSIRIRETGTKMDAEIDEQLYGPKSCTGGLDDKQNISYLELASTDNISMNRDGQQSYLNRPNANHA